MLTIQDVLETNQMIQKNNLDVRTITMGISLLDCCASDGKTLCNNIYDKITKYGEHLVETGEAISREYGVPIINKRVSVTPISLVAGASDLTSYVDIARTLDKAAKEIGINFIGGFSALVERGMSKGDRILIDSIAESLAVTDLVCSSVAVGSTKAGINMDAVAEMGRVFKDLAERTKDQDALGCAKLVVFSNAVEDNPFMAGAFHGVTNGDSCISVGVSGPGVVKVALEQVKGQPFDVVAETIRRRPSRLPASASSSPWKRRSASTCPLASSTCPWLRHRQSATASHRFWKKWAWKVAVPAARRQPWRSSTTPSRRAASWLRPASAACLAPLSLSVKTRECSKLSAAAA